jgi:hypothetical protein
METWGVVFLGVIAVAGAVQAGFLVAMALALIRLAQRIDSLQSRVEQGIAPASEGVDRVTRNVAEISDLATVQARRLDQTLTETLDTVEDTVAVARRFVAHPLGGRLSRVTAVVRGIQVGIEVFRQLGQEERASSRERRRDGEDDEHLFI